MKIGPAVRPGRRIEKKGKHRTGQSKSHKVVIFRLFGEKPPPYRLKRADLITCAKFQDEIFRGYGFTGGRISHFPIDFRMGLTTV